MIRSDKQGPAEENAAPKPPLGSSVLEAETDPATVRLLTPREQWTPAQKLADQRDEDAARARGSAAYQHVQELVQAGDLAGAVRAITLFPGGHYRNEAVQAVALGQMQAGELLAAVSTAQQLRYADTKGDVIRAVVQVLLQRGDTAGARWLAATVTGFQYVSVMKEIADAEQQAGNTDAARQALNQAREQAQYFSEGDPKNGYFRSYYLSYIVSEQLRLGDLAGASDTAQLIDRADDQSRALREIEQYVANAAATARRGADPLSS